MSRGRSKLLPFGDKNAVLFIVFLVLSLGVSAANNGAVTQPRSPTYPSLLTITQRSGSPIGLETLPVFAFDKDFYFADDPLFHPDDLSVFGTAIMRSPADPSSNESIDEYYSSLVTDAVNFVASSDVTIENTRALRGVRLTDDVRLQDYCGLTLLQSPPTISDRGVCRPASEMAFWEDINAAYVAAGVYQTGEPSKIPIFPDPDLESNQLKVSFGGLREARPNSISVRFSRPQELELPHRAVGIMCYADATTNAASALPRALREAGDTAQNFVIPGLKNVWLFRGNEGRRYLEARAVSIAEISIILTLFNPNRARAVTTRALVPSLATPGGPLPDLLLFPTQDECEDARSRLGDGEPLPQHFVLRAFVIEIRSGRIGEVRGLVDE